MKKMRISKRILGYIVMTVVYLLAVKVQQAVITARRNAVIVSSVSEWKEKGKPVEVLRIKKSDVKQYIKITVMPTGSGNFYEGFVPKLIQEKISAGDALYWIRQEGRLEVGSPVAGKVVEVLQEPDIANGMYLVRVRFDQAIPGDLRMAVARIQYDTINQVINVPIESLDMIDNRYYGWTVVDGRARRVALDVSQRNGYGAIADKGLKEGDLFVLRGTAFLEENDLVNVVKDKE